MKIKCGRAVNIFAALFFRRELLIIQSRKIWTFFPLCTHISLACIIAVVARTEFMDSLSHARAKSTVIIFLQSSKKFIALFKNHNSRARDTLRV